MEEQERFELHSLGKEDHEFYTQLFQSLDTWPNNKERSIADSVMQQIAEMEDGSEARKNRWMFFASTGIACISAVLIYYFFLPADFYQALAYLRAHLPLVLFVVGMFSFIQFADSKLVKKNN